MKKILISVITSILLSCAGIPVYALDCPSFTQEQQYLLVSAYIIGNQPNTRLEAVVGGRIGYSTAAILWKESFIEDRVFRYHPKDPSYGVMAVTFQAYLETLKVRDLTYNTIYEHTPIIETLLTNDLEAIKIGYTYLSNKIIARKDLWKGVQGYNGGGYFANKYMKDVKERVVLLQKCGIFDYVYS